MGSFLTVEPPRPRSFALVEIFFQRPVGIAIELELDGFLVILADRYLDNVSALVDRALHGLDFRKRRLTFLCSTRQEIARDCR